MRTVLLAAAISVVLCVAVLITPDNAIGQAQGQEKAPSAKHLYKQIPDTVEFIKDVEFGKGGDKPLRLNMARLKKRGDKPLPVVVNVHGGGWMMRDKDDPWFTDKVLYLAERGFFAVSIDYRLSGEAPFPAAIEDCKCAVRFLRANAEKYGINPDQIGAWGESAGGHLVLLMATADEKAGLEGQGGWEKYSSRVQAVVSWYGPTDLRGWKNKKDKDKLGPVGQFLGGPEAEKKDLYALASPITHVSADDPPALFIHGAKDNGVPVSQSENMHKALQAKDVSSRLIVIEDSKHGFYNLGPEKTKELYQTSAEFFTKLWKGKE